MAGPRRTRRSSGPDQAAEQAVERFLSRHELRYILIEILIVATGVFIALAVDELRQTLSHRQLAAETRAALRDEVISNRSRVLFKLRLVHDAALILEAHPEKAGELVRETKNSQIVPFEAVWTFATQNDVLRYVPADERRRLSGAYIINAGYAEIVHDEMTAWTALAATDGADASRAETNERNKAVAVWLAYAQRVALGSCINLVGLERALNARIPQSASQTICRGYRLEMEPSVIYRALGVPTPAARTP